MTRTMRDKHGVEHTTYYLAWNSSEYTTTLKRLNNKRRARGRCFVHANSKKANRGIEQMLSDTYKVRVVISPRSDNHYERDSGVFPAVNVA